MRLRRELLWQMVRRLTDVVMRMSVRVVILYRYRQYVGQIAFRNLLLEVLLDVVVELVECQLVAAMVRIEQLLALLSRQVRRLRIASVIIEREKKNDSLVQCWMSLTQEFMLLKQIKLEFNHVTASKHQRSQKVKQALTHKRLYNALEMCFTFLFSILWVVLRQKACLQWGYAHSQSEMNERANSDSLSLHCRHLLDFKRQMRFLFYFTK